MSLNIVVIAGYTFPPGVPFSLASLRRAALPTVSISGAVGPSDLAPGAVTAVAVAPDAYWYGLDTGVVNAALVVLAPAVTAYEDGLELAFKVLFENTQAVTLAANGLPPMPVKKNGGVDLEPGDWQAGQIVVARYQLDANIVPAGTLYAGTTFVLPVTVGRTYTWTPGGNDINVINGAQTLTATGTFTATQATVTLTGANGAQISATVVPVSNVWQMLSQLGNTNKNYPFKGATGYRRGEAGLVPQPKAGDQDKYLRADGTFQDAVALATAAAVQAVGSGNNIFNQQNLN